MSRPKAKTIVWPKITHRKDGTTVFEHKDGLRFELGRGIMSMYNYRQEDRKKLSEEQP